MQKDEVFKCTELCKQYFNLLGSEQELKRNEIWKQIESWMAKWIKSILSKRNNFLDEKEIMSISWDCFEFCLKHFKPDMNIPLPNHFYAYSKFYISMNYSNSKIVHVDLNNNLSSQSTNLAYEHIDELREFRKSLPQEYFSVFDDALWSLVDYRKDRLRRLDETSMTYYRYVESKKVFKIVIDYLLRR